MCLFVWSSPTSCCHGWDQTLWLACLSTSMFIETKWIFLNSIWTFTSFSTAVFFLAYLCSLPSSYPYISYIRLQLRNKSVVALNLQTIKSEQCGQKVNFRLWQLWLALISSYLLWQRRSERAPPPTASSPLRLPHSPPTSSLVILCCMLRCRTSSKHLDRGEDRGERAKTNDRPERLGLMTWCRGPFGPALTPAEATSDARFSTFFIQPGSCDPRFCGPNWKCVRPSWSGCADLLWKGWRGERRCSCDWIPFDLRACQPSGGAETPDSLPSASTECCSRWAPCACDISDVRLASEAMVPAKHASQQSCPFGPS